MAPPVSGPEPISPNGDEGRLLASIRAILLSEEQERLRGLGPEDLRKLQDYLKTLH